MTEYPLLAALAKKDLLAEELIKFCDKKEFAKLIMVHRNQGHVRWFYNNDSKLVYGLTELGRNILLREIKNAPQPKP